METRLAGRMRPRILATAAYALAIGAVAAYENSHPGASDLPILVLWAAAPFLGFFVGRWWAVLGAAGWLVGHAIGWDPGEHDGNPAFWAPYVAMWAIFLAGPMLLGALAARLAERHRLARGDQ